MDKYYNLELKQDYINFKKENTIYSPNYMENIFAQASVFENILNKDICNWTVGEGIDYFKYLNVVSDATLIGINKVFRSYTQYCIERGMSVDNQNHFLEITREVIINECVNSAMLEKMIVSRADIEHSIMIFTEPSDKFLILSIFEGICGKDYEEIINLRYSDFEKINDDCYVNTCAGRRFKVTELLMFYAKESAKQDMYTSDSGKKWKICGEYPDTVVKFKDIGRDVQEKYVGRKVYQRLAKLIRKMELTKNLTAKYIANSGQIDMLKREADKKGMSTTEALYDNEIYEKISYIYGKMNSKRAYIKKFEKFL